jgi:hypothetical protein
MVWQDFYTAPGGDFGILPNSQFYGPQGHRGKDFIHGAGTPIPVYAHGTVVSIPHSGFLGRCVVVRLDEGRFAGWAHVTNVAVGVGAKVKPGDTIAHVAGAGDDPGQSWAGAHSHTTLGVSEDSIFSGAVQDPMRLITPAIQGLLTARLKEDDMFEMEDRNRLDNIWAGLYRGASVEIDGAVKRFNYGVLPIVAHNQTLIALQAGRIAALEEMVAQLTSGMNVSLDADRIESARKGGVDEIERRNSEPISVEVDNIDGIDVMR